MTAAAAEQTPFKPTPWPTYALPTPGQIRPLLSVPGGVELLREKYEDREKLIALEKSDPLRHGYEPQSWTDVRELIASGKRDILIQGGNRPGKTEFAAKKVVEVLLEKEGARAWALHQTSQTSIAQQQPRIYKYIPPELRNLGKKGRHTNISYTQKNGFSENTLIFPNFSQLWFMNYSQEIKVIEGEEPDIIWCDELVPYDWVETLR